MTVSVKKTLSIQDELNRLWNEEQRKNKIHASLFNLIIYVQKNSKLQDYRQMIQSVVSKFPCRVICVIQDPDENANYLHTQVTAETMGKNDFQIYCECIQIEVAGKKQNEIPFLILPFILPDLPINVLWTQDPSLRNPLLSELEKIAKRIIFGFDGHANVQQFAKTALEYLKKCHCEVGDLSWSALSGWRQLLSQIFNSPSAQEDLRESKSIKIHYSQALTSISQEVIQAAYLQGWIAAQLQWTFQSFTKSRDQIQITYQKQDAPIMISLIAEDSILRNGEILALEVESRHESAHYVMRRIAEKPQIFIQYSNKYSCDIPYCTFLSRMKPGEEIIEEIFYPRTGKHYQNMLEYLSKIPWENT